MTWGLNSYEQADKKGAQEMGYDAEQERKAHRVMVFFFVVVIIVFIGFKAYTGMRAGVEADQAAETSATPEVTMEAEAQSLE